MKDSLSSVVALSDMPVGVRVTWHRPLESERLIEHGTDQWKYSLSSMGAI